MVKLQLTLKSDKPNFVHALNGKSFKLQTGANTLILEYDDYVSLATALGIKPIDNEIKQDVEYSHDDHLDTHEQACMHDEALDEHTCETLDSSTETEQHIDTDDADSTDSTEQEIIENKDESSQSAELEDSIESNTAEVETEAKKELIDYSSWPISRLKSKYKSVTGNVCKLKKDEIIEFLQNKDKDSDV